MAKNWDQYTLEEALVALDRATAEAEESDNWDEVVELEEIVRKLGGEPG